MEEILPLGSVVLLKNNKNIMVAGYGPALDDETQFDYVGIYAKYGLIKSEDLKLDKDYVYFNSLDIDKVLFIGCQDDKMKKFISVYKYVKENNVTFEETLQKIKDGINEK